MPCWLKTPIFLQTAFGSVTDLAGGLALAQWRGYP